MPHIFDDGRDARAPCGMPVPFVTCVAWKTLSEVLCFIERLLWKGNGGRVPGDGLGLNGFRVWDGNDLVFGL